MNVIVATDGSERSEAALVHAARIASVTHAGLLLLRVLDPRIDCADQLSLHLDEAVAKTAAAWTEELSAVLRRVGVGGTPRVSVAEHGEDTSETILRVAAEQDGSMIAMATRGAGRIHHLLLGSVAMGVLGRTALPLMVTGPAIEAPRSEGRYRVVATTDGSEASLAVVRSLSGLLPLPEIDVTLLSLCWPSGSEESQALCHAHLNRLRSELPEARRIGEAVREVPLIEGVADAIIEETRQLGASAIAMATHGHGAAYHLFAGSTALAVVSRSPLPVILARSSAPRAESPGGGSSSDQTLVRKE